MRPIICFTLLLAACSQQPAGPELEPGTFAGSGRDRLCIAGEAGAYRAGVIAFAPTGDANCSAGGRLEPSEGGWVLVPSGEGECRIPLTVDGNLITFGQPPAACAYYCGPGASISGKQYSRADMGAAVTDLAGDLLC